MELKTSSKFISILILMELKKQLRMIWKISNCMKYIRNPEGKTIV